MRTLVTYSIRANLKARPRQLNKTETNEQASQKTSNRRSVLQPLPFLEFSNFASSSKDPTIRDKDAIVVVFLAVEKSAIALASLNLHSTLSIFIVLRVSKVPCMNIWYFNDLLNFSWENSKKKKNWNFPSFNFFLVFCFFTIWDFFVSWLLLSLFWIELTDTWCVKRSRRWGSGPPKKHSKERRKVKRLVLENLPNYFRAAFVVHFAFYAGAVLG